MNIAVIYLYYVPYKIEVLQTFIRSLQQNDGGLPFQLYIVFKDAKDVEVEQLSKLWLQSKKVSYIELSFSGGFDIDAYLFAAGQVTEDCIVCFNSNSKILHPNWLHYLASAITGNIGAAGATGSWQSYYEVICNKAKRELINASSIKIKWAMAKLLLKAVFNYKRWFAKFPNPHLRTNAFFIKRKLFLQLNARLPIKAKIDAYRFESGVNSLTNQLFKLGLQVCLVDKNGSHHLPQDWHLSNIFWCKAQENLVVSDNQTQLYVNANDDLKKRLSDIAWGGTND